MKKKFGFSIESLQDADDVEIMDREDAETFDKSIYSDDELLSDSTLDIIEDAADQVQAVAEGLESIKERMLFALQNGGLTRDSADFADMAIRSTCGNWLPVAPLFPACETLVGETRLQATEYAIESIGSLITQAWGKITTLVNKWLQESESLWGKLLQGTKGLLTAVKSLEAKIKSQHGEPITTEVIVTKATYRNIAVKGKIDSVAGSLDNITHLIHDLSTASAAGEIILKLSETLSTLKFTTPDDYAASYNKIKDSQQILLDDIIQRFISVSTIKFVKAHSNKAWVDTDTVKWLEIDQVLIGDRIIFAKFTGDTHGNFKDLEIGITSSLTAGSIYSSGLMVLNAALDVALVLSLASAGYTFSRWVLPSTSPYRLTSTDNPIISAIGRKLASGTFKIMDVLVRGAMSVPYTTEVAYAVALGIIPKASGAALKVFDKTKIKALTSKEAEELVTALIHTVDAVLAAKTNSGLRTTTIRKILALNLTLAKELESSINAHDTTPTNDYFNLKSYINGTSKMCLAIMQPDLALQRQALSSARAAFNYASACVDNLIELKQD